MVECWSLAKRAMFIDWLDEAKKVLGVTNRGDVATFIGLAANSVKKYTVMAVDNKHRPGVDKLKALGDILNRDYRVLLDEPDTAPLGVSQQVWHQADQDARSFAIAMFTEAVKLSPAQRKSALELIRSVREMGDTRKH